MHGQTVVMKNNTRDKHFQFHYLVYVFIIVLINSLEGDVARNVDKLAHLVTTWLKQKNLKQKAYRVKGPWYLVM